MVVSKKVGERSIKGNEYCEKKALRSCARCRRNKTKCDSLETRPDPCTSCMKKGVECLLDYVSPPQRSKEMRYLYENIRFSNDRIGKLCVVYEDFVKKFKLKQFGGLEGDFNWSQCPTRILKIREEFFSFNLSPVDGSLCINNFRIRSGLLEHSFKNFRKLIWGLIKIYFKWERIDSEHEEKAGRFVSEFEPRCLLEKNQLLILLCILNFYYDIPGVKYLDVFEYVIESYCHGASGIEKREGNSDKGRYLSKGGLANIIVGNSPNAQFHSELFIKNFTILLFLNIVLYGPEYFMSCFMDKYIRTLEYLRKKINFDKNWEVKWVNFYIRLLNLVEGVVPFVEGDKYTVDEEEIEFLFSLVRSERESERHINVTLDCFICLVKFDQYLIERRRWPESRRIAMGFEYVCQRLSSDLMGIFGVERGNEDARFERFSFMQLFFTQLLTLNSVLCVSYCGTSAGLLECHRGCFNGFNFGTHEVIPEELVDVGEGEVKVLKEFYWCQSKYDFLKQLLMGNEDMNVSELIFLFVEVSVGRHCFSIDEDTDILDIVRRDFERFCGKDDMSLGILKSCCRFVWLLYEFVVFWDMVNRVVVYEPFVWNSQLLLENNGLMCQNGDIRSLHYRDGVVNMPSAMDVVDDDREGTEGKENGSEVESNVSEVGFSHPLESVGGGGGGSLDGGINHILQNVDWVKESADEVFEKIHNVLK